MEEEEEEAFLPLAYIIGPDLVEEEQKRIIDLEGKTLPFQWGFYLPSTRHHLLQGSASAQRWR